MEEKNAILIELPIGSREQVKNALISAIESLTEKCNQIETHSMIDWKNGFLSSFEKSVIRKDIQHLTDLVEQFE